MLSEPLKLLGECNTSRDGPQTKDNRVELRLPSVTREASDGGQLTRLGPIGQPRARLYQSV